MVESYFIVRLKASLLFAPARMHLSMASMAINFVFFARCLFMTCCVTKDTPIHFIDGKCYIKIVKSCITGLINYYACLLCELL